MNEKRLYELDLINSSDSERKAVILGFNRFLIKDNFGSEKGVCVKTSFNNVYYQQLLSEIACEPLHIGRIRVMCSNTSQFSEMLTYIQSYADGYTLKMPIEIKKHFSAYQQQSSIIDIPVNLYLDGSTYFELDLLPKTNVRLWLFEKEDVIELTSLQKFKNKIKSVFSFKLNLFKKIKK
jgi:hypothetical protein